MATKCKRCGYELLEEEELCGRCGAIVVLSLKTPIIVDGRYSLERTLGAGSMGVVHVARDLKLGRRVAIKMIAPEIAAEVEATTRFAREAATLAAIRSEHVVRVHAFGKHGSSHFFVMDYVRGKDLDDIICEYARHEEWLPIHRALTILRQVASGLAAVHAAGVVHRDVKPGNIVIEEETGRPVLVDFGLARSVDRDRTSRNRSTVGAGTPWYMAPEQVEDEVWSVISPRTDVYALGCTAFEIFCARPPFDSVDPDELMTAHIESEAPLLSSVRPDLKRFDAPIARALAKNPKERFETADAFVEALDRAAHENEANLFPPTSIEPLSSFSGRKSVVRALVVTRDELFLQLATRGLNLAFDGATVTITNASSEVEITEAALWNPPQLVILDDATAEIHPVDALSRLRAMPHASAIRMIVASAADDAWRYSVVGVRDFMHKPIEMNALVATIADLGRRNGWLDTLHEGRIETVRRPKSQV